jgi:Spy/CpxP family protein refolding chaperone
MTWRKELRGGARPMRTLISERCPIEVEQQELKMSTRNTGMVLAASLLMVGTALAQPYGGGPGMMGGHGGGYGGGYGMGPGMMGESGGGYGMGPGMMGGRGAEAYAGLKLTPEQKKQITAIQQDNRQARWQLMGTMQEQGYHMHDLFGPGTVDEAATRKAFEQMQATQKAMFDLQLDAQKKINAVLTAEQREQLRR